MTATYLLPGGREAVAAGCWCPVLDNARGEGYYRGEDGNPVFVMVVGCPIHTPKNDEETDRG